MKSILIIGAGRSASALIHYLCEEAGANAWEITVADANLETAQQHITGFSNAKAALLDIYDTVAKDQLISQADVVISMLPAHMHMLVAVACLQHEKHLLTASYAGKI